MALPGLCLTAGQVQRLYALDMLMCEAVLAALVDVRFLTTTDDGRYVRRDRSLASTCTRVSWGELSARHAAEPPAGKTSNGSPFVD